MRAGGGLTTRRAKYIIPWRGVYMYQTILFDFDGTVFDTGEGIMKSVQYAAESFGYHEPELEALRCFVGPPLRGQFMKRYGVDAGTAEQMVAKYRERYSV